MRKMARIVSIDSISPIENADAIEVASVGGWKVVVKKNEFQKNSLAVFFEIDSWIPYELAPFLSKDKEPREFNGVKGERLRTVKLRGITSQGLLLPMNVLPKNLSIEFSDRSLIGEDVSHWLNIQKWEMTISPQMAGQVRGNFPSDIPKTDQERCQNLVNEISVALKNEMVFEITEKLEGSSMTCYLYENGEFGVCSRNLSLKEDENNVFWKVALSCDIQNKMKSVKYSSFAIQGELVGPGIQKNIYGLEEHQFFVFDVYDIKECRYLSPKERKDLVMEMGLFHVPVLFEETSLSSLGLMNVDDILSFADGSSVLKKDQLREGLVFKSFNDGMTFKAISNNYLLRDK